MSKIVIGLHGLANKPKKSVLQKWWKQAAQEGLQKNLNKNQDFAFEVVYWADILYKNPMHHEAAFAFDNLYDDEPYAPAEQKSFKEYKDGFWDSIRSGAENVVGGGVDFFHKRLGMDKLANWVLGKVLKDLAFYYSPTSKVPVENSSTQTGVARKVLQNKLISVLDAHKNQEIFLVAHSMGSIIAYDVLRDLGRQAEYKSAFSKLHLVTIGSPLGIAHVKSQIKLERSYDKKDRVRSPTIVSSWVNFADPKDIVAVDSHLADDYAPNKDGVQVRDDLVLNEFVATKGPDDKAAENHHKSYGYLRTPEFSKHLQKFLEG